MKKLLFGVIAAQPADMEQRRILSGIMSQSKKYDIDVAIISNIYNPNETDNALNCENEIYDLILSNAFDAFILISEAIINPDLQQQIMQHLIKKDIPIIIIGSVIPSFTLPNFKFINTSDEDDIEAITNHLIDSHGFCDIDILTGYDFLETSHLRVNGYKNSLKKHNIPFDEKKVFFGNFWLDSGCNLANQYISGEISLPQAIICTNDYMAYGILDRFSDCGISVPKDVTVIGYEYALERLYHTPILTTYQRNREALGVEAINQLYASLLNEEYNEISSFEGKLIYGDSCSCGSRTEQFNNELKMSRADQVHKFLDLFSQFDQRLTECRNIYEFLNVCYDFRYLMENIQEYYLCLYDSWYENATYSEKMVCYSVLQKKTAISLNKYEFSKLFSGSSSTYYLNPLFFANKSIGYVVLKCNSSSDYNHTFRNLLKSVANGLEVLHMKNDIQYLTQCQSLSNQYDLLTNLYNKEGMEIAYRSLKDKSDSRFIYILLRICIFDNKFSNTEHKISAILDTADALREFCGTRDICGRVSDTVFACFINKNNVNADQIADNLISILVQKKRYMLNYGMDSFICISTLYDTTDNNSNLFEFSTSNFELKLKNLSERRDLPYYEELLKIRNKIYFNPEKEYFIDDICSALSFSAGHFRSLYKKCFQISFYQDYINSKIAKAKFLLCTTNLYNKEIADKCGYNDEKYFLRQFSKTTGITPNQYRLLMQK